MVFGKGRVLVLVSKSILDTTSWRLRRQNSTLATISSLQLLLYSHTSDITEKNNKYIEKGLKSKVKAKQIITPYEPTKNVPHHPLCVQFRFESYLS